MLHKDELVLSSSILPEGIDYLLWYAKDVDAVKVRRSAAPRVAQKEQPTRTRGFGCQTARTVG